MHCSDIHHGATVILNLEFRKVSGVNSDISEKGARIEMKRGKGNVVGALKIFLSVIFL